MENGLINILESILGGGKKLNKNNYSFYCPICRHHKRKLIIDVVTTDDGVNDFHCWTCTNTKGKSLITLFKLLNASYSDIQNLIACLGTNKYKDINTLFKQDALSKHQYISLPKDFKHLAERKSDPYYQNALCYIKSERLMTDFDILKYHVGYCDEGEFKNKIILPSYDDHGSLNYFTARSYIDSGVKYKNPDYSKNIVPFSLYINWKLPIVLVEGIFDAIAVKRNAIPLLGKTIPEALQNKIITERVKDVYICLDNDAKKQAIYVSEIFMNNGINVYFVDLYDKDPSKIGFESMIKIIKETKQLTFSDLIKMKLQAW